METENVLVIGIGEVGKVIVKLLKENNFNVFELDVKEKKIEKKIDILHICYPYENKDLFTTDTICYISKFDPKLTIIHSTVAPETSEYIYYRMGGRNNIVYSPIRGQHDNLYEDIKRYTKFIASNNRFSANEAKIHFNKIGLKTSEKFYTTTELELAKLLDTTQYGILISWTQEADRICKKFNVSYEIVNKFGRETQTFYGVRPQITPGFCGGNCVCQNISILNSLYKSKFFEAFIESNSKKAKELGFENNVKYD